MKLVIDIDENVFTRLFDNSGEDYGIRNDDIFDMARSIRNGTPPIQVLDELKAMKNYCTDSSNNY